MRKRRHFKKFCKRCGEIFIRKKKFQKICEYCIIRGKNIKFMWAENETERKIRLYFRRMTKDYKI
jgi:hypothetical protein